MKTERILLSLTAPKTESGQKMVSKKGPFREQKRCGGTLTNSCLAIFLLATTLTSPNPAHSNPYLAKTGEAPVTVRIATCALSGGFMHLYSALDHNLFGKYGINAEHIQVRSTVVLAALATDQIQFVYCAASSTIPGMVTGIDATILAAALVGNPYVLIARKDIKTLEDLRGKSIGVASVGSWPYRLLKSFLTKHNLENVQIRALGGSQPERYNALMQDIVQAGAFTPPLDARGKRDGLNVLYNLSDLGEPSIYSSLHTNAKSLRERRMLVQRVVATLAEALHFVEKNPEKAKASLSKVLKVKDEASLQSAYDTYAKRLINRRLVVPATAVAGEVEVAREAGTTLRRKANDLYDNSFAENLEESGFLKELWGGKVP